MAYKYSSTDLLKKFFDLLSQYKYYVILVVILVIISSISLIYAPKILGSIMGMVEDTVYDNKHISMASCINSLILMTFFYILSNVSKYFLNTISFNIAENISAELKRKLHEKINTLPVSFFNKDYPGNVVARINLDIANITSMINSSLLAFLTNILLILFIVAIMLITNALLAVMFIIITVIYMFILNRMYIKTRDNFLIHQEELGEMMGFVGDFLPNRILVQSVNAMGYFNKRFKAINDKQRKSFYKSTFFTELYAPLTSFLMYIVQIILYVSAGVLLYAGLIDVEVLAIVLIYIQIYKKSILSMAGLLNSIQKGFASLDRLLRILEYPVAEDTGIMLEKDEVKGKIEFKNVSYGDINNFNLKINNGEVVELTGSKSKSLIDLLLNFSNPDKGEIYLDGVNIKEYNSNSLRKIFGISLDDDLIFYGTVFDNIAYGGDNLGKQEVIEISKRIGLNDIIERFPEGYDTIISEDAMNFSSGEKKLICLARALIGNPKVLVLGYSDYLPMDMLKDFIKDKTVIILTSDDIESIQISQVMV